MLGDNDGRVIAVLGSKIDSLTSVVLQTNARLTDVRREVGEIRSENAVNAERWVNHRTQHEKDAGTHADTHKRERGIFSGVVLLATTVSGTVSAWWNGR